MQNLRSDIYLKIMIVDDEMIVREDIKTILDWNQHYYQIVAEAGNGKQACKLFQQEPVDIVIADIEMPVMNGLDMASQILKLDPHVKFVFLTAYSDFGFLRTAMKMGIHSYILKHEVEEKILLQELDKLRNEINRPSEVIGDQYKEEDKRPEDRLEMLKNYIDRNLEKDISLEMLADLFQLSESYMSRLFKLQMGLTFKAYLKQVRMEKAKKLLLSGNNKISDIARKTGYSSVQYFYLVFKQYYGFTPSELLKKKE